ncbi:MAG TPA: toll/interleukin-1 receptor domain-containing protein [Symbiobacteriaceae bacterium]|jgi:hypothetical protein
MGGIGLSEVFLSHNHKDKPWVRELHDALQQQGVGDIFLDEYAIDPGERLIPALEQGLADTRMLVLVWSASAAGSRWVGLEREMGLVNHLAGVTARVVPILLDDTPLPGFLRLFVHEDARSRTLPELAVRLARSLEHARRPGGAV